MATVRKRADTAIEALEASIGVRKGFIRRLLREDDWSFVIKLHAVFEATCTHLLLFHFQEPDLSDVFSRLELSNKATGKVAFLSKLELLNADNRRFISTLSELRNSLVHDVRHSEFSLAKLVEDGTPEEVKSMAIAYSPGESLVRRFPYNPDLKLGFLPEEQELASVQKVIERLRENPKLHIWAGGYHVLGSLVEMYGYSHYKQWIKPRGSDAFGADMV